MKNYLNSIGKAIINETNSQIIAYISDIVFDPDKGVIKGIITNNDKILLFSDISYWKNVIHVPAQTLFPNLKDSKTITRILNQNISILGNKVIDEDKNHLGYCENIIFNEKTGTLMQIMVRKYFLGFVPLKSLIISALNIIEITQNHILIKSSKVKATIGA